MNSNLTYSHLNQDNLTVSTEYDIGLWSFDFVEYCLQSEEKSLFTYGVLNEIAN
jgi:hypothetical protein